MNLVDKMEPDKDIILEQLLCPVPAELNEEELTLAHGGVSLEHLSEEERRHVPILLAQDTLFKDVSERIVIFNCRDLCTENEETGRCDKCFDYEADALLAGYLVLGELANLGAPIKYISLAGTTSGTAQLIAPRLEASGNFKFVFGNGYHISSTVYAAVNCFSGSYLKQVREQVINVTSCVKDLFVGLEKEHLLPGIYENLDLCMVRDISGFSTEELAEVALKEEIKREMGRKEYAHQRMKGIGIGGAPHKQRVEWGQALYQRQQKLGIGIGGATSEQLSEWGKLGYAAGL